MVACAEVALRKLMISGNACPRQVAAHYSAGERLSLFGAATSEIIVWTTNAAGDVVKMICLLGAGNSIDSEAKLKDWVACSSSS